METTGISPSTLESGSTGAAAAASALGGDDFFQLLIAQLVNQDPLEPTSNQELLNQISSIREIELSTTLTKSLESLTDQQRFAAAGGMIGRTVSGMSESGAAVRGTITAVRFDATGNVTLELESGERIPLDAVESIMSDATAAEDLTGKFITGVERSDANSPRVVEGIVTGFTTDDAGHVTLELDTGESLGMTDVIDVRAAAEAKTDVSLLSLLGG